MTRASAAPPEPLRVVVGTAGHIDHGKTALVRALTGIDCDRLPEEKARGITIDLGFAHGEWDGVRFGFVDVPGHERFVRNMLAGACGIDLVLLVVAADESVRPQTREHLEIVRLLGIPAGVVALTKVDRADRDLVDLVRLELEALLAGTALASAPVVATSAVSGEGIDALRRALAETARGLERSARSDALPPRLAIDRAFVVKGFGPVVTGTLAGGRVRPGDRLLLHPVGREVRVRGVQVHGEPREEARAGERTSLNLAGVEIADLERGQTLAPAGTLVLTRRVTVELEPVRELGRALSHGERVRFHLGTSDCAARLAIPSDGPDRLVQIRLGEAIATRAGDRFVIRGGSPIATLGGGRILDPSLPRLPARDHDAVAGALLRGSVADRIRLLVDRAGSRGLASTELAPRLGLAEAEVETVVSRLVADGSVERFAGSLLAPAVRRGLEEKGSRLLAEAARADRTATAIPTSELKQRLLGRLPAAVADAILAHWSAHGPFTIQADRVVLPGRSQGLPEAESATARRILEAYENAGWTEPPSPTSLAASLGVKPQIVQGLVRHLVGQGRLVKLPGEWIVAKKAVDDVASTLRASGRETIDVAGFKELFGLTRKLAIPLLEWLDQNGVTRREGDRRRILGTSR